MQLGVKLYMGRVFRLRRLFFVLTFCYFYHLMCIGLDICLHDNDYRDSSSMGSPTRVTPDARPRPSRVGARLFSL